MVTQVKTEKYILAMTHFFSEKVIGCEISMVIQLSRKLLASKWGYLHCIPEVAFPLGTRVYPSVTNNHPL